jgi:hypothetical protein
LGEVFVYQIREHIFKSLLTVKNKEGDIFFISPIDIVFIELSRGVKNLYLNKLVCRNDRNNYVLEWYNLKPLTYLLSYEQLDFFIQVHRKYYVRMDYPFKIALKGIKTFLHLRKAMNANIENELIYDKQIPVGKRFKKLCCEIFGER